VTLTRHAHVRAQQRGIPELVVDLGVRFGTVAKAPGGASMHYFDKKAQKRLEAYAGDVGRRVAQEYSDVYVILSGSGSVITTGHRTTHVHRDLTRNGRAAKHGG
jgi:hypothetical protein